MAVPRSSIDALFPQTIDVGWGIEVHPLTMAHYALLEKIDSYLVRTDHAPDPVEVVKTLYICTHSARETMENFGSLDSMAMEWAEKLPPAASQPITRGILKQIEDMQKVIPHVDGDDKKKVGKVETAS